MTDIVVDPLDVQITAVLVDAVKAAQNETTAAAARWALDGWMEILGRRYGIDVADFNLDLASNRFKPKTEANGKIVEGK